MSERMRVALGQFNEMTHERLTYAKQMGVSGVQMNTPLLPDEDGYWKYEDLKRIKDRVDSYGLRLEALENTPRVINRIPRPRIMMPKYSNGSTVSFSRNAPATSTTNGAAPRAMG